METILKVLRGWGAPAAASLFFALWCVAEAGRMGGSFGAWEGKEMLIAMTLAIAVSAWQPYASLALAAALLAAQLLGLVPAPASTHWAIYIGSFIALAFILWTAPRRTALIASGANAVFAAAMALLMLSWRYGAGVGWFHLYPLGDRQNLMLHGPTLASVLVMSAIGCAAVGLLFRGYERQGWLFRRQRDQAEASLRAAEVDLVVEQERTRIGRDLHDVLAHSLAVIAAQADGARYLGAGQPQPVLEALETISGSARRALVDAQRVIEGVRDEGPVPPQPGLDDVSPLLGQMRGSLHVERSETGTPVELSAGQQLAVFRIVQECLTNALRHGGRGTAVRVHLDWSGPGLTLHVASALGKDSADDAGRSPEHAARLGRGIPGMRERAHLAGGWLTAGPDGEDFRVTAFVPYGSRAGEITADIAGDMAGDGAAATPDAEGAAPSSALPPGEGTGRPALEAAGEGARG